MVAVVGSHSGEHPDAVELGSWLAGRQVHLLTGGGPGVMEEVCKGFVHANHRRGCSIAILPVDEKGKLKPGYPNPWVDIPIFTHLHGRENADGSGGEAPQGVFSRNQINARSAHVMVAFAGGRGTLAEVALALELKKPVLALLPQGKYIDNKDSTALVKHFGSEARLRTFADLRFLEGALVEFL